MYKKKHFLGKSKVTDNLIAGFTLLELLIVGAMIAGLAGLIIISFPASQKRARDTRRKSDLEQYRNSIGSYSNKNNGIYPDSAGATINLVELCPILDIAGSSTDEKCKDDPKAPSSRYLYQSNASRTQFIIWTELEINVEDWAICSNGLNGILESIPVGGSCPIADVPVYTPTPAVATSTPTPAVATSTPTPTLTPTPASSGFWEDYVKIASDDAEESTSDGSMRIDSTDLEMTLGGSSTKIVGIRFVGVNVPKPATITSAYITFRAQETLSSTTNLVIRGEDNGNSATFNNTLYNISGRNITSAQRSWNGISTWTYNGSYNSPDISNVISEIMQNSGWNTGNPITIIITGSGKRDAFSYDSGWSSSKQPFLHIDYTY